MLLSESVNLPQFITKQSGKFVKLNADARSKRDANASFLKQSIYNDEDGEIWLDVKNKDFYTIANFADNATKEERAGVHVSDIYYGKPLVRKFVTEFNP